MVNKVTLSFNLVDTSPLALHMAIDAVVVPDPGTAAHHPDRSQAACEQGVARHSHACRADRWAVLAAWRPDPEPPASSALQRGARGV